MCQVVLIRAGATLYDEQNRVQGVLDIPLSENGQGEVTRMANELAERMNGTPLAALYCGTWRKRHPDRGDRRQSPGNPSQADRRIS